MKKIRSIITNQVKNPNSFIWFLFTFAAVEGIVAFAMLRLCGIL